MYAHIERSARIQFVQSVSQVGSSFVFVNSGRAHVSNHKLLSGPRSRMMGAIPIAGRTASGKDMMLGDHGEATTSLLMTRHRII